MTNCYHCNKKNNILINCKCDKKYCLKHIQPEIHKCSNLQDFKTEAYEKNKNLLCIKKEKPKWML